MPPQRRSQPNLPPQQNNEQQNREIVANIRMRLNAQELDIIALKVENEIIRKQNDSFVKTIKHLEKINKEMEETVMNEMQGHEETQRKLAAEQKFTENLQALRIHQNKKLEWAIWKLCSLTTSKEPMRIWMAALQAEVHRLAAGGEPKAIKEIPRCGICLDALPTVAFAPCDHIAACRDCYVTHLRPYPEREIEEQLEILCPICHTVVDTSKTKFLYWAS